MKKTIVLSTMVVLSALGLACEEAKTNTNANANKPVNTATPAPATPAPATPAVNTNADNTNANSKAPADKMDDKKADTPAKPEDKKP